MKKGLLLILILLFSACDSSELKQAQDELNKLKVEYETLQNKVQLLEGTALTDENHVTLKKSITFELKVIDKRIVTKEKAWDNSIDYDIPIIVGFIDSNHDSLYSVDLKKEDYNTIEIGKCYLITGYAIFVSQSDGVFTNNFVLDHFEEITEQEYP